MVDLETAIIITAIIFISIIIILTAYKTMIKSKERKNLKDDSYNAVESTKAISRLLSRKGIKVDDANVLIRKAETLYSRGDYSGAKSVAEEAKRILDKSRQENLSNMEDKEKKIEIPSKNQDSHEDISPTFMLQKKYPENYLAAKFSLEMAQSIYDSSSEEERKGALIYLQEAKNAFEKNDFAESLRYSIKTQKFLKKELNEIKCPNCGVIVDKNDKYCWNCGFKLKLDKCPNCGAELHPNDKFCRNCGYMLV
ncbi:MAG: zinc ribbon domain-containing protein [Thermoplasmata archaeon]